jgi:nicotinate-nucleotide adenylyltransferase
MPRLDVSSTDLRRRVAEGRPIGHLVPDAVVDEIAAHGWYRKPSTVGGTPAAQEQG